MTFASAYAILVGLMMMGWWAVTLARGLVPGSEAVPTAYRGRVEMLFHWAAEFATAGALLAGGRLVINNCGLRVEPAAAT